MPAKLSKTRKPPVCHGPAMPADDLHPLAYEHRMCRVLSYIYENLDGDLSLDAVAEVACLSRFHFHRVFKGMTGETLAEAVRRIRLFRASRALVTGDASVTEIARAVGYPNLASFSRTFSAAYGASPAAFREAGASPSLSNGGTVMHPISIKTLDPAKAAGVAHKGPYHEIGSAFNRLGAVIGSRGLMGAATGMVAVYRDGPGSKPDAELSSHAAVLLGAGFPPDTPGLDYFDLDGGRYAVLEHKGPYATLGAAWDWLYGEWLPKSGEEPRDAPPYEVYVNDPRTTPAEDLRTDIRLPLK